MAQEQKNTNLKPEHLSDDQMGDVSGGADNLIRDLTEWEKKAQDEQRGMLMEGYVCPVCGTANSTFCSGKQGGSSSGPDGTTIPVSNYHDCKCYNCGHQVGEISYFPK